MRMAVVWFGVTDIGSFFTIEVPELNIDIFTTFIVTYIYIVYNIQIFRKAQFYQKMICRKREARKTTNNQTYEGLNCNIIVNTRSSVSRSTVRFNNPIICKLCMLPLPNLFSLLKSLRYVQETY